MWSMKMVIGILENTFTFDALQSAFYINLFSLSSFYKMKKKIHIISSISFQADWPTPMPAIGRIANFSSLRKHNPKEYSIYDAYFGMYSGLCFNSYIWITSM